MRNGQPQRDNERIQQIIGEGNYEALVSFAEGLGKKLVEEKLTTSQIRNVFGEVKRLQMRFNATGTLDEKRLRMLPRKEAGRFNTCYRLLWTRYSQPIIGTSDSVV
jgi:hypothetical protein